MGSGTKRKLADQPVIILRKKQDNQGIGAGQGHSSKDNDYRAECPSSFELKLNQENLSIKNSDLFKIKINNNELVVLVNNYPINLNLKNANLIKKCLELGFNYEGIIRTDGTKKYVQFHRRSS